MEDVMRRFENSVSLQRTAWLAAVFLLCAPLPAAGQDKALTIAQSVLAQSQAGAPSATLTLEDAVRIALENQPRIKQAIERVRAQEAVLGQEMAAYYPSVRFQQSYGSGASGRPVQREQEGSTQANLDFTLYNFGKREGAVQSERDTLYAQRFNYSATMNDTIFGVRQAYYQYLAVEALVRVREEAVKSRDLLVNQARGFFEVGTRAKIDVARAESNLYSARADLIAAQNGAQIGLANLKNAMGVDQLPGRPVLPAQLPTPLPILTLDEARETAFVTRPELKSFEAQRKAQDQRIATARRGHLPDLVFGADVGRAGSGPSSHFRWPFFWDVGVSLTIPIFDGLRTTYEVQEELRNYYLIRAQEEEQKQAVALEVESSYLRIVEAEGRIKANDAALAAARENFELANGRYQVGVGTIIEVTDAQSTYTDAQTRYIQSVYDYKIAEAQLTRAIGER
jgi:outer membrane protein TolC